MCGIIGYTGKNRAVPYLLEGLKALEYRGYDSAGIALMENGTVNITKTPGRLSVLESLVASKKQSSSTLGIGHTRWATHGEPSKENSHPHLSRNKSFAVVHNGIIENHRELREELIKEGFTFQSQTDTEVIAQLFEKYYNGSLISTAHKVRSRLKGAYAVCLLSAEHPDEILCIRYGSPLVVGSGREGVFVASDTMAISDYAEYVYKPCAEDTVILKDNRILFFDSNGNPFYPSMTKLRIKNKAAEKGEYDHFMLKEITEQPTAIKATLSPFIKDGDIRFPSFDAKSYAFNKIYIVACGSAYHVGVSGKYILEELCSIPTEADIASEFRYRNPPLTEKDLCIVISQSGETADSISAIKTAKEKGCPVLGIVNVQGSTVADMSDWVIYTSAGPEIAVATTKAYTCQLALMSLIAIFIADRNKALSKEKKQEYLSVLQGLPPLVKRAISLTAEKAKQLSEIFTEKEHAFFIGRGSDYPIALESALKLKEISYIHAEAYPAGELKHGTISLIEPGTTVIALLSDKRVFSKTESNVREVKARGARIIAVTTEDNRYAVKDLDRHIFIPHSHSLITPILEVIPMQLLSYYTALNRNCDVDKPRNLAKSVTVE